MNKNICQYNYENANFMLSASHYTHLPSSNSIEIAFFGRSNAGKSSAINVLTNQKKLTKTSKTPGKTKLINFFKIKAGYYLVDLPGYGYAKTSKIEKIRYQYLSNKYIKTRTNLKGLVILMDIRHPMMDDDQKIIQKIINANIPILILLTKADKISYNLSKTQLSYVKQISMKFMKNIEIEIFSSLTKQGVNYLRNTLDKWFSESLHNN